MFGLFGNATARMEWFNSSGSKPVNVILGVVTDNQTMTPQKLVNATDRIHGRIHEVVMQCFAAVDDGAIHDRFWGLLSTVYTGSRDNVKKVEAFYPSFGISDLARSFGTGYNALIDIYKELGYSAVWRGRIVSFGNCVSLVGHALYKILKFSMRYVMYLSIVAFATVKYTTTGSFVVLRKITYMLPIGELRNAAYRLDGAISSQMGF